MKIFNFLEREWDMAIILDSCRYDYFKSIHTEHFDGGKLEKQRGASCTTHWIQSVYREKHPEIVYVSANPWINSLAQWNGFDPRNKFYKILDVWDWGWEKERKTIPPHKVTEAGLNVSERYGEKKIIIHYLQPHYPYKGIKIPEEVDMHFDGVTDSYWKAGRNNTFFRLIDKALEDMLGRSRKWELRESLGLPPNHIEEHLWRNYSPEELRSFYRENLRWVLNEVERLLENVEGKIVITSDHGEALGEKGEFFHQIGTENPAVREIPFWTNSP